jgi:hypothetical protein
LVAGIGEKKEWKTPRLWRDPLKAEKFSATKPCTWSRVVAELARPEIMRRVGVELVSTLSVNSRLVDGGWTKQNRILRARRAAEYGWV